MKKIIQLHILVIFLMTCTGCKMALFSDLSENAANEMMAALMRKGIQCSKEPEKEAKWSLHINKSDMVRAWDLLREQGYPKEVYANIGTVFKKEGLVSSQHEERVRFIYALSQELSDTISKIDGVLVARVHIVIPENDILAETIKPSSASVFIKHSPESGVDVYSTKIKTLVVNSIEGLTHDKVTVALFQAENNLSTTSGQAANPFLGISVSPESSTHFKLLVGGLVFMLVSALAGLVYFAKRSSMGGSNVPVP